MRYSRKERNAVLSTLTFGLVLYFFHSLWSLDSKINQLTLKIIDHKARIKHITQLNSYLAKIRMVSADSTILASQDQARVSKPLKKAFRTKTIRVPDYTRQNPVIAYVPSSSPPIIVSNLTEQTAQSAQPSVQDSVINMPIVQEDSVKTPKKDNNVKYIFIQPSNRIVHIQQSLEEGVTYGSLAFPKSYKGLFDTLFEERRPLLRIFKPSKLEVKYRPETFKIADTSSFVCNKTAFLLRRSEINPKKMYQDNLLDKEYLTLDYSTFNFVSHNFTVWVRKRKKRMLTYGHILDKIQPITDQYVFWENVSKNCQYDYKFLSTKPLASK